MTGTVTVTVHRERASYRLPAIELAFGADSEEHYQISEGDPAATRVETKAVWTLSRGDWRIRTITRTEVSCTSTTFDIKASLTAFEGETQVSSQNRALNIPRKGV